MDDKTQKERLEQELRFLKESFEAEVISKEEFEKGKDRIERKLKEIQASAREQAKEELKKAEEPKTDEAIEKKTEEKIKLKVIQDEIAEKHEHFEPLQIKTDETAKKEEEPISEKQKTEIKEQKNGSKFFKYAVVFLILILLVFFSYSFLKNKKTAQEQTSSSKFAEINAVVLNDEKNCFNCNPQRVLGIMEEWFGALNTKKIDYNTIEGKNAVEKFDAKMLPLYILDENITKKPKFEQFKKLFSKKDNSYVLNEDVAAPNFYIKRENVPNKLDLFVIPNDNASIRAEKNLKEFLEAFKDVKFDKHLSTGKFAEELQIRNFPAFLVNNRVRFSGVHSAETIKDNFCKLNKLPECEKSLSKSLI